MSRDLEYVAVNVVAVSVTQQIRFNSVKQARKDDVINQNSVEIVVMIHAKTIIKSIIENISSKDLCLFFNDEISHYQ